MKYEEGVTEDDFALEAIRCALHSAKPSFANHKMFKGELGEGYVIASCYNGLLYGGGAYTLCRLILGPEAGGRAATGGRAQLFCGDREPLCAPLSGGGSCFRRT